MGGLSPIHIAILVGIALLVFGPKKLPEMGRSLGKGIREFKQATSGLKDEFDLGLDLQHLNPLTAITEPTTAAAPVATATATAAVTDESAAPASVTSAESAAGATLPAETTIATLAGPVPPAVGEADVAALAAYGIDVDGNPVVTGVAATHVVPPAPPSVFIDANGNEYHLAVAPAIESSMSASTQAAPAGPAAEAPLDGTPAEAPPAL